MKRKFPFGYRMENGTVMLNIKESDVVENIFIDYLNGNSLSTIAKQLNDKKIEYMPGVIGWNKARLKRIIEDKRYIGAEGYPQIITVDIYNSLQEIKNDRNTQVNIDRASEIFQVTVPVYCPKCGSVMRRRRDNSKKYSVRWICLSNECKKMLRISDENLLQMINASLNSLICDQKQIGNNLALKSGYNLSVIQLENEINRALEGFNLNKDELRAKMLECVTEKNVPSKINAGETAKLEASVYPSNAEDKTIFWESSDTSVLLVSDTGSLTAVGVGTATITAKTSRGTSKKFIITVNKVIAESISIANNDTVILINDTQTLGCEFTPENTTYTTVEWASSDESVIFVSADGEITANKLGTATITATHKELTESIDIEVKPIDAESIEIVLPDDTETNDEGQPKVNKGSKVQLKAEIEPENTTYKDIEWSGSDENIATIDKNGTLSTNATGIIVVTATAKNGVTEEIEIEVYSDTGDTTAGIVGLAVIGGGGAAWYYRRKKKKEDEA